MKYINVIDPVGAICGDEFVAISHRVAFDSKGFYGYESLISKSNDASPNKFKTGDELLRFLQQASASSSGSYKNLTWFHD